MINGYPKSSPFTRGLAIFEDYKVVVTKYVPYPHNTKKKRHIKKWRSAKGNTFYVPDPMVYVTISQGNMTGIIGHPQTIYRLKQMTEADLDDTFNCNDTTLPRFKQGMGW